MCLFIGKLLNSWAFSQSRPIGKTGLDRERQIKRPSSSHDTKMVGWYSSPSVDMWSFKSCKSGWMKAMLQLFCNATSTYARSLQKTLIVKACQEAVVYGWTPLCVFWMDDQGKDAYLNDGVKPTKSRFSAACTYIPPVHMHRYAHAATGWHGTIRHSLLCVKWTLNGHMLLPCTGCSQFEFAQVERVMSLCMMQTKDLVPLCKTRFKGYIR